MALSASNGPAAALMASELMARGRESAAALEALLQAQQYHGSIRELAEKILCCLDRALAALHGEGDHAAPAAGSKKRSSPPGAAGAQTRPPKRRSRAMGAEIPPSRVEKRSMPEDGFLWRKYGQKEIQNSKYQRTYFRCAYKLDNGCKATRQVQRSEDDPSVFVITYFGEHTCGMDAAATADKDEKLQPLVISFGSSGTSSTDLPWLSSSDDDVVPSDFSQFSRAVSLPDEVSGGEQKASPCSGERSVPAPPAEPSSSADDLSCDSQSQLDLDCLLHNIDWEDCCGDSLFVDNDTEYFLEEAALITTGQSHFLD